MTERRRNGGMRSEAERGAEQYSHHRRRYRHHARSHCRTQHNVISGIVIAVRLAVVLVSVVVVRVGVAIPRKKFSRPPSKFLSVPSGCMCLLALLCIGSLGDNSSQSDQTGKYFS